MQWEQRAQPRSEGQGLVLGAAIGDPALWRFPRGVHQLWGLSQGLAAQLHAVLKGSEHVLAGVDTRAGRTLQAQSPAPAPQRSASGSSARASRQDAPSTEETAGILHLLSICMFKDASIVTFGTLP